MPSTTDFEKWIDANPIEEEETRDALIEAIERECSNSPFSVTKKDGRLFVKKFGFDLTLCLPSAKARQAFLYHIADIEIEEEDELEAGYRRNIENPHA